MSQFGDLVRKLRKDKGLTLEDVAKKIGSHKGYVSGIENGKVNPPSVKFIRKFARIFRHDEREMVRIAYVDKAPAIIRDEIRSLMLTGPQSAPAASAGLRNVPLLNTADSGYSTRLGDNAKVEPVVDGTVALPESGTAVAAATVCDNSMERRDILSFSRGDVIFLQPLKKIRNGAVVLIVYTGREGKLATLRQVMVEQDDNVVLQPFNKDFPLEFLTHDDIDAVYAVTGKLEMFEPEPNAVPV